MTTSERIRQARKDAGLTQEQLAQKLGVQHSVISKYERGRVVNLKREKIAELASALNVKPSWLMCMDDKKESDPKEIELDIELLHRLMMLTPEELEKVDGFVVVVCGREKHILDPALRCLIVDSILNRSAATEQAAIAAEQNCDDQEYSNPITKISHCFHLT